MLGPSYAGASSSRSARWCRMAPPLKVFRTPIGFHDAYVAAPSQKAALEAWGADANLFARGAAERVTDPALMAEPLAHPGKVIRRRRASPAEHFASLSQGTAAPDTGKRSRKAAAPAPPKPLPSRAALDRAERALDEHRQRAKRELAELEAERARLVARIDRLRKQQERETTRLIRAVEEERRRHEAALGRWRAS